MGGSRIIIPGQAAANQRVSERREARLRRVEGGLTYILDIVKQNCKLIGEAVMLLSILKRKGIVTDEELKAEVARVRKEAAERKSNEDKSDPEASGIQSEGTRIDENYLGDEKRDVSRTEGDGGPSESEPAKK